MPAIVVEGPPGVDGAQALHRVQKAPFPESGVSPKHRSSLRVSSFQSSPQHSWGPRCEFLNTLGKNKKATKCMWSTSPKAHPHINGPACHAQGTVPTLWSTPQAEWRDGCSSCHGLACFTAAELTACIQIEVPSSSGSVTF